MRGACACLNSAEPPLGGAQRKRKEPRKPCKSSRNSSTCTARWRAALEHSNNAARQFGDVQSVDELLSAQSRLVGSQVAHFMEIWRGMFRAMGDTQMTLWSQMQSQFGQNTELMRQAYDLTKRATEDATRMAASQVTSIAREAQPQEPTRPQQRKTA